MQNAVRKEFLISYLVLGLSVAVGLWAQYKTACLVAVEAAEAKAWAQLDLSAETYRQDTGRDSFKGTGEELNALQMAARWIDAHRPGLGAVVVVDRRYRITAVETAPGQETRSGFDVGALVEWTAAAQDSQRGTSAAAGLAGRLQVGSQSFLAISHPLAAKSGHLIWCVSGAYESDAVAVLQDVLPKTGILTWFWICTLVGIGMYMVFGGTQAKSLREKKQTTAETLRKAQNLIRTRDAVIFGLAKLADSRDPETGDHLERICFYSTVLASAMRRRASYRNDVTPSFVRLIGTCAALHDIGKVGVEDSILKKPGPLTSAERLSMEKHTFIGGECLREIEHRLGASNFLHMAQEIAMAHHERWDGAGYPYGLSGAAIPLSGRIVAICDVYDALASRRVYKEPIPHEEVVHMIGEAAGSQFDPGIVEVWMEVHEEFRDIARRCGGSELAKTEGEPKANDSPSEIPQGKLEPSEYTPS